MFKIGNLEIKTNIVLAPMAGYTCEGFREFMSSYPIGACYTEMVSDMGLIYGNQETLDYLPKKRLNIPTGLQLFGSTPENLKKAAIIALNHSNCIDFIDVNMGCPVPKVCKTGAGSSLLKNPQLAGEIIRAIKGVTSLPVTAKIRLGYDDKHINFNEMISELVNAGVDAVAIHARTTKQLYSGKARYELIKDIGTKWNIPIIISGDIFTYVDALKALEITKAQGVMVARGIVGNPLLINQINDASNSNEVDATSSYDTQKKLCIDLANFLINEKGEATAMRMYRGIAPKFFSGYPNVKYLNRRLSTELVSLNDLISILNDYENYNFETI